MKYLDSGDLHTVINNDGEAEDLDPGKNYLEQYQDYRSSKDNIGRIRKINLKDKVYYYSAFVRDEFGYPKRQSLGNLNTLTSATALRLSNNLPQDWEDTCKANGGFTNVFAYLTNAKRNFPRVFSYPISLYRGGHTNSEHTLSLFFERLGKYDEIYIQLHWREHTSFLKKFHTKLREAKEDIEFAETNWNMGFKSTVIEVISCLTTGYSDGFDDLTQYGSIDGTTARGLSYTVFSKNFKSIVDREESIVMDILERGYDILDRKLYYVGGGVQKGSETFLNLGSGNYAYESYEYVEHGIWKLKFKIK